MEKKRIMDDYIYEFMKFYKNEFKPSAMKNLLIGGHEYSFTRQMAYEDPEYLNVNVRNSIKRLEGNPKSKDTAIRIYKRFLEFLNKKGISVDVEFPPIPISNTFERLMYTAKFFHDPEKTKSELSDTLLISNDRITKDIKKLRDEDGDPLQICGRKFTIPEIDDSKERISFSSTAHPLFLTQNLAQVLIMLKGLKAMSENRQYANYAITAASDIWEQLSDYAKKRIRIVLSDLLPDDLTWYESLEKKHDNYFMSEYECSVNNDVIVDTFKNDKTCFVEAKDGDKATIYHHCRIISEFGDFQRFTFRSDEGEITLTNENYLRSAYTPEELV